MNKLRRHIISICVMATLLLAVVAVSAQAEGWSQNVSPLPAPTGFVNDYAGVIDAGTKQKLETKLKNLRDTTDPSVEIAVAVVKTTGDRAIFDYSLAVARGWKIGSKADDNPSALLFIAIDDRKYFTQVSKDLEDELPDGVVGSLQRQYLVPEFKKGNYSKGISDTIDAYISAIRNKGNTAGPAAPSSGATDTEGQVCAGVLCFGLIFIFILIMVFASRLRRGPNAKDRSRWGGGAFGANDTASSALPWIVGSIVSGIADSSSSSSSSDWSSSSSSSDWGGFSGGGDFGGGGAGGDW